MTKQLYLRSGKDSSLRRFHPWVFSGAVARMSHDVNEGDVVRVLNDKGEFIAVGHYQIGSIAVRVLAFEDINIDDRYWATRLGHALEMRRALGLLRDDNNMFRLVHGEGDGLPGLVVDVYGSTIVVQAHSVGMHYARHAIAKTLKELWPYPLKAIYYKSETTLPFKANLNDEAGFLLGSEIDSTATEYGLQFHIDPLKGQKTGFFVDQRENRHLLEHYAKGRRVLNMFCYTGGFSVYAMRGGALQVDSVDSSERAVSLTDDNIKLNFPEATNHHSFAVDAFKYLQQMDKETYDLIVLDPPAFAKHKEALRNALKGYTRLNAKAFEKIRPGGILFTFSCSQAVNKEQFRLAVFTAAAQSGRSVRILHQLHQPADHPVNIYHPEGEYLKGLVLYVE